MNIKFYTKLSVKIIWDIIKIKIKKYWFTLVCIIVIRHVAYNIQNSVCIYMYIGVKKIL